ncbi:amidohydrolase family protein [candidate division CSSED10-310 bacterium]|uniref:Amidohydrolase family protein n=1 Tax=candidate division CSSED10-310 bacterium TaxID=2855610 RepID=A0ABV6YT87_UNCC1
MKKIVISVVLVLVIVIFSLVWGKDSPEPSQSLALINGLVIDGTGSPPVKGAVIVISKPHIVAVGPSIKVKLPPNIEVIDVQGSTILPGFINTHVHHGYSEYNLQAWARAGVTTVRDLGANPRAPLFSIRDNLNKINKNARLIAAGPFLTAPAGYPLVPFGSSSALELDTITEVRQKVKQLLDQGADVIKCGVESGDIFGLSIPVLSLEKLSEIVRIAHEQNTRVSAHISVSKDLERALNAGVDDIAHMAVDSVPDRLIKRMIADDVYWVPTLELWTGVGHGFGEKAIHNLRRFNQAGGKVALGTDYGGYITEFDLGMPDREIKYMQEAGMTPAQIIMAATRNAAYVCNLADTLGTIEPGKIADLLVVKDNPLHDLEALTEVQMVIHNGVIIRSQVP